MSGIDASYFVRLKKEKRFPSIKKRKPQNLLSILITLIDIIPQISKKEKES